MFDGELADWSKSLNSENVEIKELKTSWKLPVLIEVKRGPVALSEWIKTNKESIEQLVHWAGGILFRGFCVNSSEIFEKTVKSFGHDPLPYLERTAPRVELRPHIYTSTEHPNNQYIHFHNANSYSHCWPRLIWFCSIVAATEGGYTPIADCRRVLTKINKEIVQEFESRKVMYVRNFREGVGLSWQVTFQSTKPEMVKKYCKEAGIEIDYFNADRLRIRQIRHATAKHPVTGERVWFNQAHLFHPSSLSTEVSKVLRQAYSDNDMPRNAYFGDGGEIDISILKHIRNCYKAEEVSYPWVEGDFLVLDNMLAAHSRTPYKGERLTIVAFANLYNQ